MDAPTSRRHAFAARELLVILAIVVILIGLVLPPAIQRLRESSRQARCLQNLTNIGRGLADYSLTFTRYPAGSINPTSPIRNEPSGFHHNWIGAILPSLDYPAVYELINPNVSVYAPENAAAMAADLPILRCPTATMMDENASNYAGVHHPTEVPIDEENWGMLILNVPLSEEDVPDGLAATLSVGEKLQRFEPELGWLSGTRATLRNLGHPLSESLVPQETPEAVPALFVGGFASEHPTGVAFLRGDSSVRMVAPTVDQRVLQQLADRRDSVAPADYPAAAESSIAESSAAESSSAEEEPIAEPSTAE